MNALALIQIETFTGLPAHPFLNRIAMYVVPTALLVGVVAIVRPAWRSRLAPVTFGLAVAALLSVQLTMGAGEVMDNVIHRDANPAVEKHEDWSKLLRVGLAALVVATGAFWAVQRRSTRRTAEGAAPATTVRRAGSPAVLAMAAVVGVAVAANAYLTVMTAHTGSTSVYAEDGELLRNDTTAPAPGR